MVLRKGRIYSFPVSPDNIIDQQVLFGDKYVGKVTQYDKHRGATVYTGIPPFIELTGVSLSSMRQIVISTLERVNDLQPNKSGVTIRPLKLDQWNYAISNFDLNGDNVQFGWWKESENDPMTYFQLSMLGGGSSLYKDRNEAELKMLNLIRLARQLNPKKYSDEEVLDQFLTENTL